MRLVVSMAFLITASAASQTFIVDAANGPGAHYTDLPAAVAAVPDGAVLLVRPGHYTGFAVAGKGLSILGEGAKITGSIALTSTQSHQGIAIRGLRWTSAQLLTGDKLLKLANCAGPVLVETLEQPARTGHCSACAVPTGIHATSCAQICVRDCQIGCTALFDSCTVTIDSCQIRGEHSSAPGNNFGRSAVVLWGSDARVCGASDLRGGDGWLGGLGTAFPGVGIQIFAPSTVRLLDGRLQGGRWGPTLFGPLGSANSTNTRMSPRVKLVQGSTYTVSLSQTAMPSLSANSTVPGGAIHAATRTEVGDLVVLAVGLRSATASVPGFVDGFWLDPVAHVFQAIGVQQASAPVTGTINVPNWPGLVGQQLVWHAACFGPVTGQQNSNPAISIVH